MLPSQWSSVKRMRGRPQRSLFTKKGGRPIPLRPTVRFPRQTHTEDQKTTRENHKSVLQSPVARWWIGVLSWKPVVDAGTTFFRTPQRQQHNKATTTTRTTGIQTPWKPDERDRNGRIDRGQKESQQTDRGKVVRMRAFISFVPLLLESTHALKTSAERRRWWMNEWSTTQPNQLEELYTQTTDIQTYLLLFFVSIYPKNLSLRSVCLRENPVIIVVIVLCRNMLRFYFRYRVVVVSLRTFSPI